MAYTTQHVLDEARHTLGHTGRYVVGNFARFGLKFLTGLAAATAGVAGTTGLYYATALVGVGAGVGLQAYLNHREYEHNKHQLTTLYRKEIASYFGKDTKSVTVQDLELLAERNPSVEEQLRRERTKRNVKTGIWIAGAAIGFIAAASLVTFLAPAAGAVGIGLKLLGAGAGLFAFRASHPLIEPALEKAYHLDKPTTVELVQSLEWRRTKGQKLTQAQVMEVFASADAGLNKVIHERYGAPFAELSAPDKQRALLELGKHVHLEQVTDAINEGRMNARELTFFVHQQSSNAYPDPTLRQQINDGISQVKDRARNMQQNVVQAGQRAMNGVRQMVSRKDVAEQAVEEESPTASAGFQQREDARRATASTHQEQSR